MNVTVLGLWHLGCVTAACCAEHFAVTGLDFDADLVRMLELAMPISEPGLDDLAKARVAAGALHFASDPRTACAGADVLWVCDDTPVDDDDIADTEFVFQRIGKCLPHLPPAAIILVSSQLPVGSCARLEREFSGRVFAYSPENLRLGKALEVFRHPERVVIGVRDENAKEQLGALFAPFSANLLWMSPESAEMTKHAINSFFAASITFTNELARLCERIGADAKQVEQGMKSEPRIGPRAYVAPGGAFAGGTLARDVRFLVELAEREREPVSVLPAILQSNAEHRRWTLRTLETALPDFRGATVAILGLPYKPGTDTLRRSSAIDLCRALLAQGSRVRAFDPAVKALPAELHAVELCTDAPGAMAGADAVVIGTEWPEFRQLDWPRALGLMRRALVIDASRFVLAAVERIPGVEYRAVGVAAHRSTREG